MTGKKIKNVFICFIAIIVATMTMFMGDCTFFDDLFAPSDNEDADNKLQAFVDCLNNEDREGIKSLFAPNKIAEISVFDESIEELLLYYYVKYIFVEHHLTGVEEDKDSGIERKWYKKSYHVTTDAPIYRMAFYWCAKDTGDKGNVGIESFYIIKATDDPNYDPYFGFADITFLKDGEVLLSWFTHECYFDVADSIKPIFDGFEEQVDSSRIDK